MLQLVILLLKFVIDDGNKYHTQDIHKAETF